MQLELFQIDSFTNEIFRGNPACVVPLPYWLPDEILLKITKENAVSETAFFVEEDGIIHLRWFTPEIEMDLCGHATLATAHVLKTIKKRPENEFAFKTMSGDLTVTIDTDLYILDFPSRPPAPAELPETIKKSLGKQPLEVLKSRDYVLVYQTEKDVLDVVPDKATLDFINLDPGGIIITAPGNNCDFVSRFYVPGASIFEDPVTGSAHCSLIPYWSKRLGKKDMIALQLSSRGGKLFCQDAGDRVYISGHAKTYSAGVLWTE